MRAMIKPLIHEERKGDTWKESRIFGKMSKNLENYSNAFTYKENLIVIKEGKYIRERKMNAQIFKGKDEEQEQRY